MTFKDKLSARRVQEQKLRKHRDLLVESLRTHLLPVFIQQGFAFAVRAHKVPSDRKSVGTFPFEPLRRASPDGGVDQVEIELRTYGRAAFRINACAVPKDGMTTLGGHRTAEECLVHGIHDLEMYAYPRWFKFFSLWLYYLRSPKQADYNKLALRVVGFVPELELALREDRLGPHMRRLAFLTKLSSGGHGAELPK
jgi:hypothetical protein